ncbi:diguanylate cyclase (GGDEF)-like protein [Paenibacillus sp. DS2015]|uniref:GGDEF domain-containing response regulator n=1 Tax=Paenibacillus sp. DS2015 TaxID=3373917 RepID=UPI003D2514E8
MIIEKYKPLVEQRIRSSFDQWANKVSVEEKEIYRFLHNLKGTAGTIGMKEIEKEAELKLNLFSDTGTRDFKYSEWYALLESLLDDVPTHLTEGNPSEGVFTQHIALSDLSGNRILIIDDDVDLAAYLKGILEERNYPVNIALTAERGLKLFYDWKPDMILLDILLPDTNGMDVLKQIVEKSQLEHSPIIVISSEDTRERRIHAYRSGAMDFFGKPIDSELLIALIDNRFRIKQQWEHSIIIDELTGIYNRKHFNRMISQLISNFLRTNAVFSVVIMDLDHFKQINDSYGHLMGDEVLRSFAAIVMDMKREEDIFCRYGGEEFALLLPNTDREQALELLQHIREQFLAHVFSSAGQHFMVTFSAGITDSQKDNAHIDKLVKEADQALYLGKQSGRNQTILFSPQMINNHNQPRLNILVVDDDPLIRDLVVTHLLQWQQNKNIQVLVKGYEDGLQFIHSDWYSEQDKYIILLDGAMPTMDGVEVLNKLREEYPERNIVVAMLTARINQTDIIHALQHGADDYIVKPFQISELLSRVERLVKKILNK